MPRTNSLKVGRWECVDESYPLPNPEHHQIHCTLEGTKDANGIILDDSYKTPFFIYNPPTVWCNPTSQDPAGLYEGMNHCFFRDTLPRQHPERRDIPYRFQRGHQEI